MVTNGGSHAPEKWAAESAAQITDVIVIEPTSIAFDAMTTAKASFEADVETALVGIHDTVQSHEVSALDKHGTDRLVHDLAPEDDHINAAVAAVTAVADKTMFAAHFRKPEVQAFIRSTLGSHFATVKHIERSWVADKNPDDEKSKIFRARNA